MSKYPWAANLSKLQRAEAMVPDHNEEAVKEAYIKLGGKVLNNTEQVETPLAPTPPSLEEIEEKSDNTIKEPQDENVPVETPLAKAKKRRLKSIP